MWHSLRIVSLARLVRHCASSALSVAELAVYYYCNKGTYLVHGDAGGESHKLGSGFWMTIDMSVCMYREFLPYKVVAHLETVSLKDLVAEVT